MSAGPASQREPEVSLTFGDRHIAAVLATVAAALFALATRLRLNEQPWGDEPHYLIMSIALGKYHTFDLTEAYASFDYAAFYPTEIDAHVFPAADGTMVPLHNFGGPLLWTVPFQLWGRAGAAAVIVLASVLIVINIYHLLRELGIVQVYAGLVTGLFIIGTPLYMYASMQFIEPLGALMVIYAVRVVLHPAPTRVRVAVASAGVGYLPWVHGRFMIFTVILGLLLVARVDRRTWRGGRLAYLPAVAPMALLLIGLEVFNLSRYGTLSPAPGNANFGDGLFQIPPQTGLAGLLFDRQFGLLSHFPLLAVAVPGMLLALRRRVLPAHVVLLAVIVPYVLAVATFRFWWAGFSPPGRLLAVLAPLLAYYVAVTLQRLHAWTATTVATLAALAAFAVSVTGDIFTVARFTESGGVGVDPVLAYLSERLHLGDVAMLLPDVRVTPTTGSYLPWYMTFAAFVGLVWLAGRGRPVGRTPVRPLADLFPVLARLVAGGPAGAAPDGPPAGRRTAVPEATTSGSGPADGSAAVSGGSVSGGSVSGGSAGGGSAGGGSAGGGSASGGSAVGGDALAWLDAPDGAADSAAADGDPPGADPPGADLPGAGPPVILPKQATAATERAG